MFTLALSYYALVAPVTAGLFALLVMTVQPEASSAAFLFGSAVGALVALPIATRLASLRRRRAEVKVRAD